MQDESCLCGIQNCERSCSTTEMQQTSAVGRDRLIVAGAGAEEVAEFIVATTEALRRNEALEAPHASCSAFHALMIYHHQVTAGAVRPGDELQLVGLGRGEVGAVGDINAAQQQPPAAGCGRVVAQRHPVAGDTAPGIGAGIVQLAQRQRIPRLGGKCATWKWYPYVEHILRGRGGAS
jgi:hypothetical protein